MPATTRRTPIRAAALFAAVLVAACSGRATGGDDTLKRDLDAAGGDGLALAPRGSQTQVVSAIELGGAGKAAPAGAPSPASAGTPAAPHRLAARAPAPRVIERVRYVDRVVERRPAPEPEVAAAPEPAPEPTPTRSEPAPVAAPSPGSRHLPPTTDVPARRGRGTWDMGDVIRNAPFPINP